MYTRFQPGLASMESYPYQEIFAHSDIYKCRYNVSTSIGTTTGYVRIKGGNETLLKDIIANVGPISFAMNSAPETFLFYGSGIYDDPTCTPGTQHSAIIYGYGTAKFRSGRTVDYWLCKNAWSTNWGGMFKIKTQHMQHLNC